MNEMGYNRCIFQRLLLVILSPFLLAHGESSPKRDAFGVDRDGISIEIDYAVPRGELAASLRRLFDRDRSGTLDESERGALARHLTREATAFLSLSLDDRPLRLTQRESTLDAGAGDERLAVHVVLRAVAPLPPGDHLLRIQDRHKDRRIRVPATITLAPAIHHRTRPPFPLFIDGDHPISIALRVDGN